MNATSKKIWFRRSFRNSCLSASETFYCTGVSDVAVTVTGSQTAATGWKQSVGPVENISPDLEVWQPGFFSTAILINSFLLSLVTVLSWGTFGVWDPSQHCAFFLLFVFNLPIFRSQSAYLLLLCLLLFVITIYNKDLSPSFPPALLSCFYPPRLDASTGPPTAAVVSAVSVLRPAGVGGRLAFVAVQESGRDDQNGPQEKHPVDDRQTTTSALGNCDCEK